MIVTSNPSVKTNEFKTSRTFEEGCRLLRQGFVLVLLYPIRRLCQFGAGDEVEEAVVCGCGSSECEMPGKHPIGFWSTKEAQIRTEEELEESLSKHPNAGVALHLGESGIAALDVDERHGGIESLRRLEKSLGPIPKTTYDGRSGKSAHYYFRLLPGQQLPSQVEIAPGLEFLSGKHLIVVAPSEHHSGERRQWIRHPEDVSPFPLAVAQNTFVDGLLRLAAKPLKQSGDWVLRLLKDTVEAEMTLLPRQQEKARKDAEQLKKWADEEEEERKKPREELPKCLPGERCPRKRAIRMRNDNDEDEIWWVRCASSYCTECLAYMRRMKKEMISRAFKRQEELYVVRCVGAIAWRRFLQRNYEYAKSLGLKNQWAKIIEKKNGQEIYWAFTPFPDRDGTLVLGTAATQFAWELISNCVPPDRKRAFASVCKAWKWAVEQKVVSDRHTKIGNVYRGKQEILDYLAKAQIPHAVVYPWSDTLGAKILLHYDNREKAVAFIQWLHLPPRERSLTPDERILKESLAGLAAFDADYTPPLTNTG